VSRAAANRLAIEQSGEESGPIGQWRLDDRLVGVDKVFRMLARPDGKCTLHALEAMRLMHDGAVLGGGPMGLPADQAALLDCLLVAPAYESGFVKVLYWMRGSVKWKCDKLGIGQTKFNKARDGVLSYFRGQMHQKRFMV
jgi:hypothetical protein